MKGRLKTVNSHKQTVWLYLSHHVRLNAEAVRLSPADKPVLRLTVNGFGPLINCDEWELVCNPLCFWLRMLSEQKQKIVFWKGQKEANHCPLLEPFGTFHPSFTQSCVYSLPDWYVHGLTHTNTNTHRLWLDKRNASPASVLVGIWKTQEKCSCKRRSGA